jgi:predicted component of type VI protein secretion system
MAFAAPRLEWISFFERMRITTAACAALALLRASASFQRSSALRSREAAGNAPPQASAHGAVLTAPGVGLFGAKSPLPFGNLPID